MKRIHPVSLILIVWLLGLSWMHVHAGESRAALCENEALKLADEGRIEMGIAMIKNCLEQSPKRSALHVIYGDLLLRGGDYSGAGKSFDEALKLRPSSAAAKTGKGRVLAHEGKLDEAITIFMEALKLNPDPSFTHYQLGLVYEKKGDLVEALAHYKDGISIYESHRQ